MQSLVEAFGVFLNQSMTILSSNSPTGTTAALLAPLGPLRFFGFGAAGTPLTFVEGPAGSSVAFRLLFGFWEFVGLWTTGLPARLPPLAIGLVARGPAVELPPLRGLFPRLTLFCLSFGALGLVARFATMEWPPRPDAGTGDVARGVEEPF